MKRYRSLMTAMVLVSGIGATTTVAAAPSAVAEAAESMVQLQKTAPIEADAADPIDIRVQSSESSRIQAAPGFAKLKQEFEAFLEKPTPTTTQNFPIPPENFIYQQGGVGLAHGLVNRQYFGSCFKANYGILGGSSDRVLTPPVRATADSGVSPYLDEAAIKRLQSLQVKFRYAFAGSFGSSLSLYLVNLSNQKTQFVGTLPSTSNRHPRCATVTQDLTHYINQPGVYGVRLVMVNRGRITPYPQPFPRPYKAGENPGDVVQLDSGEADVMESSIAADGSKFGPIRPFFNRKAVAGFDHVVVTVTRR
jgi:hypothetical protein